MPIVAAVGIALMLWSVGVGGFYAWVLRRRGDPARRALRVLLMRPTLWLGIVLVVAAVSTNVALGLLGVGLGFVVVLVARRARARRRR